MGKQGEKGWLRTHPSGAPVFGVRETDVRLPTLTFCGLLARKSKILEQIVVHNSRWLSICISLCVANSMLKAELKSTNSILTYVLGFSI